MDEGMALVVFVVLEFLVVAAGMVLTMGCLRKNKKPRCGGQRMNELCVETDQAMESHWNGPSRSDGVDF